MKAALTRITHSLDEFVRSGSQEAFREVMRANIDLVFTVALRQVRDHHLAEDVTQAVFIILARKAPRLGPNVTLGGWLVKTTRLVARDALKLRARRRHHESVAGASQPAEAPGSATPQDDLAKALDCGLGRLNSSDRDVVILRYYKGRTHREIAQQLSISEPAAKKKVARAIEQLRRIVRPSSGEVFTGALTVVAVQRANRTLGNQILSHSEKPSQLALQVAKSFLRRATFKLMIAGSAVAVGVVAAAGYAIKLSGHALFPAFQTAPTLFRSTVDAKPAADAIPAGWPVVLPGAISGTPVMADIERPGQHCVVVACVANRADASAPLVHSRPDPRPLVFALHADGSIVDGFPVALDADLPPQGKVIWASSPSIVPVDGSGREGIVIASPQGRVYSIRAGRLEKIADRAGPHTAVPVVSSAEALGAGLSVPVGTTRAVIWPAPGNTANAGSSVGHLFGGFYLGLVAATNSPPQISATDHLGHILRGWPRQTLRECTVAPALGDVDGDGPLEVCAADLGGHLYLWHIDGSGVAGTHTEGAVNGIFRDKTYTGSTPTLVDIDGDGRAAIVLFDTSSHTLFAWHGDGTGVASTDGAIARLPEETGRGGVSVAHLGDGAGTDFFVGTSWIHLAADFRSTLQPLLSESPFTTTSCTIADLFDTGTADVLFGTADGRVFVYRTRQKLDKARAAWPTANGNSQHTGTAVPAG